MSGLVLILGEACGSQGVREIEKKKKKRERQQHMKYTYGIRGTFQLVWVGRRSGRGEGPRPRHTFTGGYLVSGRGTFLMPSMLYDDLSRVSIRREAKKVVYMREPRWHVPSIRDV